MKYQGVVTQQDWKEGIRKSPTECAFARAIRSQFFPGKFVIVYPMEKEDNNVGWTVTVYSEKPLGLVPSSKAKGMYTLLKNYTVEMIRHDKGTRLFKGKLSKSATILAWHSTGA